MTFRGRKEAAPRYEWPRRWLPQHRAWGHSSTMTGSRCASGEIEAVHRVGSAAVADLLALWQRASEWERRTRSARQAGWTPSEILRHVAESDRWYAARLSPDVSGMALPDDPAEAIRRADRAFIGVVRAWWSV